MKCKATVLGNGSVWKGAEGHPCQRGATRDGFCASHHPEFMAKREAAAVALYAERKAKIHKPCIEAFAALKAENDVLREMLEAEFSVSADVLIKRHQEIIQAEWDSMRHV